MDRAGVARKRLRVVRQHATFHLQAGTSGAEPVRINVLEPWQGVWLTMGAMLTPRDCTHHHVEQGPAVATFRQRSSIVKVARPPTPASAITLIASST